MDNLDLKPTTSYAAVCIPGGTFFCEDDVRRTCIQNIAKLSLWVLDHIDEIENTFDMKIFMGVPRTWLDGDTDFDLCERAGLKSDHPCGTCACFAGHGPMAGVDFIPGESWTEYTERVFLGSALYGGLYVTLFSQFLEGGPRDASMRAYKFLTSYPNVDPYFYGYREVETDQNMRDFFERIVAGNFTITVNSPQLQSQ